MSYPVRYLSITLFCWLFSFVLQAAEPLITGKIESGTATKVLLIYNENVSDLVFQQTKEAAVDKEGAFSLAVNLRHAYAAVLRYEKIDYPIFVRPGSHLNVRIDAAAGTLSILDGDGADDAKAYQHIRKYFPRLDYPLQWTLDQQAKDSTLTPATLYPRLEERQRQLFAHFNQMQAKLKLSEAYTRYEKNNIFYGTAIAKYAYLGHYQQQKATEGQEQTHALQMDSLLVPYPIISPFGYALNCRNFTQYLAAFLEYNYATYVRQGKVIEGLKNELSTRWEVVGNTFPTNLRDYGFLTLVVGKYFNDSQTYDYLDKETFNEYMKKFRELSDNADFEQILSYEYLARYNPEALKGVTDSPYGLIQYRSLEAKRTTTQTFDHFLQTHKGNVIFVEFWESACQPAVVALPEAARLISEFDKEKVVFLFISLDREKFKWQRTLRQNPLPDSYQYHIPQGTRSALAQRYGVIRLPRHLLFSKSGELIESEAPGFDQADALRTRLRELLQTP